MQEIPFGLRRQLPSAPRGTRYVYVDDQLLLINVKTRVILDFINIKVPINQNTYNRKPAPRTVDRVTSYQGQRPDHQPPSHARAHEVAKGKPFTDDEHPSSHGESYNGHRGKPDRGDDHPSQHAKNDRGHGQQEDRGKPQWRDDHQPSSQGHGMGRGKPDQGKGHSSQPAQGNQGRNKGGYPKDKNQPTTHSQMDKGNRGGQHQGSQDQQGRPSKGHDRPSKGKGKPSIDSPMVEDSGSQQMNARGKPDKGKPKGRGKQKDTFADSTQQEDSSVQSSSPSKNKGKPSKQDRNSTRGSSGQKGGEQFQPDSTPEENIQASKVEKGRGKGNSKGSGNSSKKNREESNQDPASNMAPMRQESTSQPDQAKQENIQVAKIEKGRGKGSSKGPGKPNKMNRGKRKQQTDMTPAVTQQKPTPTIAPMKPAITASIAPSVFDNNQRSIIQSYYKNSGSKKSGKGRGKKSRGSKRNKTSSVAKNDILTQPSEPLPRSLESQLPPAPPNSKRVLYNQQVLLVENGTNKVLDVINVNN